VTSSGLKPATFQLVALFLNQLLISEIKSRFFQNSAHANNGRKGTCCLKHPSKWPDQIEKLKVENRQEDFMDSSD
jgi:hypothetical protein